MNESEVRSYALALENTELEEDFQDKYLAFYLGGEGTKAAIDNIFLLVQKNKTPVQMTLRCDRLLSKVLQEKYIEVMPAKVVSPRDWVDVVASGQLDTHEIKALIFHSYKILLDSRVTLDRQVIK